MARNLRVKYRASSALAPASSNMKMVAKSASPEGEETQGCPSQHQGSATNWRRPAEPLHPGQRKDKQATAEQHDATGKAPARDDRRTPSRFAPLGKADDCNQRRRVDHAVKRAVPQQFSRLRIANEMCGERTNRHR